MDESRETSPPPLDAVPWLMASHRDVNAFPFEPWEAELLGRIDGRATVAALLDATTEPRRTTLRTLARWLAVGLISLR